MKPSKVSGFTVIEMITVIAIVAILLAVLTPVVSNMMGSARRSSDSNNLRQLAMAYIANVNESGASRSVSFTSLNDWAVALAQAGNFNEPALFFVQGDPAITGTLPTKVHTGGTVDSAFGAFPLSVAAPKSVNLNGSAASTPVVWTRGLQTDGTWAANAPYGTKGGYVAFLDGHVAFYKQVPTATITIPAAADTLQRATSVTP